MRKATISVRSSLCTNTNSHFHSVDDEATSNDVEAEPAPQLTEDELIEQRRKKREAIKAKYRNQQPPLLVQALEQNTLSVPSTPQHESSGVTSEHASCEYLILFIESKHVIY